jgi:hypothetical protein
MPVSVSEPSSPKPPETPARPAALPPIDAPAPVAEPPSARLGGLIEAAPRSKGVPAVVSDLKLAPTPDPLVPSVATPAGAQSTQADSVSGVVRPSVDAFRYRPASAPPQP